MKKDQLFRKHPSDELFLRILNCFGLSDLDDSRSFSRNDLKILKTVKHIENILPQLIECYLPCKARSYLTRLTEKNVVTVLRQILRTRGYTMLSREKYVKGHKFIIYSLTPINRKEYNPVLANNSSQALCEKKKNTPVLITFD